MPLLTRSTGDLITATIWNQLVSAINNTMAHKTDGQTIEFWGATPKTIGPRTGDFKISCDTADQGTAWLRADGRTVGSASSGGTARANADMQTIFVFLWNTYSNSVLPIQDSSGSPTTRGASGAADFSANKRMPLPDMRGRVVAGMDDPGSGAANRITNAQADINGGVMGSENHTLTTAQLPNHAHDSGGGTGFLVAIGGGTHAVGGGATFVIGATTGGAGSGNSHNNTQPTFFANYFIYTGL